MKYGKILQRLLLASFVFLIITTGASIVLGKKPPWSGGPGSPGDQPPPVSAPEPTALSLIAVGAVGVAGYCLAGRKRKK